MLIAISSQNAFALVIATLAVLLLIRQIYRLATGKTTKCSCSSLFCQSDKKENNQCPTSGTSQESADEKDQQDDNTNCQ